MFFYLIHFFSFHFIKLGESLSGTSRAKQDLQFPEGIETETELHHKNLLRVQPRDGHDLLKSHIGFQTQFPGGIETETGLNHCESRFAREVPDRDSPSLIK